MGDATNIRGDGRMPRKTQIREFVKKLTLFDDVLFRKSAEDLEFCQEYIGVCLDDPDVVVLKNLPQNEMLNFQGRSAVVDLLCQLGDGRKSIVEVQKDDTKDHLRAARYHTALLTVNTTDPGADFANIPNIILIYVTKFDLFKINKVKCLVKRTLLDSGQAVDDG